MPFVWGSHDCGLFACRCYEAVTGVNLTKRFEGYGNEFGARRKMIECGAWSLRDLLVVALGQPSECDPCDGDILMVQARHGPACAVYADDRAVSAGPSGLVYVARKDILAVWSI